jgi:hypothetical protein
MKEKIVKNSIRRSGKVGFGKGRVLSSGRGRRNSGPVGALVDVDTVADRRGYRR